MPDKITLVTDDFTGPTVPEKFLHDLKTYDPTLLVRWNPRKMRFVIEQCVEHHAAGPGHDHLCARIYVLLVQDPEGAMMGLHSGVMEMIRARDVTKAGYGPDSLHRWQADRNSEDQSVRATIKKKQDDAVEHSSKINRTQLLRAFNLMSRHSLEVNQ